MPVFSGHAYFYDTHHVLGSDGRYYLQAGAIVIPGQRASCPVYQVESMYQLTVIPLFALRNVAIAGQDWYELRRHSHQRNSSSMYVRPRKQLVEDQK